MVGTLAVGGTPDEVRARVSQFENVVDRVILGGAWVGPPPERVRESYGMLLQTFGDE
jgi:hypothetical protein